jgi:transcriptional regulator with PAS, ATPase and Fis domain
MDNFYSELNVSQRELLILKKHSFLNKLNAAVESIPNDQQYTPEELKFIASAFEKIQKSTSSQNENLLDSKNLKNISNVEEKADLEYDKNSDVLDPKEEDFMDKFFKDYKILSKNRLMLRIFNDIKKIRKLTNVLITGESGTGKEGIAHAIHYLSKRKGGIISLNMAGSSDNLESELFGHVKGAFTDAIEKVPGAIQLANKGTLFFDEIGDISLKIQKTLLRALQENKVKMKGSNTEEKVDFRLVSATNKDLIECVKTGEMREDFYKRIKGVHIHLPPLNSRRNDIPILANYFFQTVLSKLTYQDDPDLKLNYNLIVMDSDFTNLEKLNWSNGNVRDLKSRAEIVAEVYFGYLEDGINIDRNMLHKIIDDPLCELDEFISPFSILTEEEVNCIQLFIQMKFNILKVAENFPFGRDKANSIINNALIKLGSLYEYETNAIIISLIEILEIEKFNENEKLSKEINSRFIRIIEHHRPQPKIYSNDLNTNVEDLIQVRKNFIPV